MRKSPGEVWGVSVVTARPEPPPPPPVTRSAGFWPLMGYAAVLGVFDGFAGLVFLGVVGDGEKWNVDSNPHWLGGHWWWVSRADRQVLALPLSP